MSKGDTSAQVTSSNSVNSGAHDERLGDWRCCSK
jgi:hypothetical protein